MIADVPVCEWNPGSNRSMIDPVVAVARLNMPAPTLTHSRLLEALRYDAESGILMRRSTGRPATNGARYPGVFLDGRTFQAARLAVMYVTGEMPQNPVEVINGNPRDLRFGNLRERPAGHQLRETTAERVRELFDYDEQTGRLQRKVKSRHRGRVGDEPGNVTEHGYREVHVDYQHHYAHRLVWLWVYGKWPDAVIDHINGNRLDNRTANLRDVPQRVNCENQRARVRSNKAGLLGVTPHGKTSWRARIVAHGVTTELGCFETPEAAHGAYVDAKRLLHEGSTL